MNQQFVLAPQPTVKRRADLEGADFYPTPAWATHALIQKETFSGDVWECACGDGAMSQVLTQSGLNVISSDLHDRGFGSHGVDFTKAIDSCANVITNPPYNLAEDFVRVGLKVVQKKLALLLRLAFLEGAGRQRTIFSCVPPARIWVFSERITFYPKGAVRKGSGTTAYAWFIWDKECSGPTELAWLPVGLKKQYS